MECSSTRACSCCCPHCSSPPPNCKLSLIHNPLNPQISALCFNLIWQQGGEEEKKTNQEATLREIINLSLEMGSLALVSSCVLFHQLTCTDLICVCVCTKCFHLHQTSCSLLTALTPGNLLIKARSVHTGILCLIK